MGCVRALALGCIVLATAAAAPGAAGDARHADTLAAAGRETFVLPYDLALEPDGTIVFLDRSRILARHPKTGRVRVRARIPSSELVALERLADGTLFVTDFPGNRILRVTRTGRVSTVARVEEPADLVADEAGTTLWVASIAEGVGVVRVDVASGSVEPFASPRQPHGIDRAPNGDFVVHDGHAVSRIDGDTGAVARFADVDAFKLNLALDGSVYGVTGDPSGGRIVRIAADGRVTRVAGTGRLAPHRDGPALRIGILPSSALPAPGGAVLFTQVEPRAAVRRIDRRTGLVRTLALGR
jgi:streptogramin lyase